MKDFSLTTFYRRSQLKNQPPSQGERPNSYLSRRSRIVSASYQGALLLIRNLRAENQSSLTKVIKLDDPDGDCSKLTAPETKSDSAIASLVPVKPPVITSKKGLRLKQLMAIALLAISSISGIIIDRQEHSSETTKNRDRVNKNKIPPAIRSSKSIQTKVGYNVTTPARFAHSPKLKLIVDRAVKKVVAKGLSNQDLSISLIDLNSHTSAGYQQDKLRYPASVIKLFWMVAAYGHINRQNISLSDSLNSDIARMIQESDNDSASRVLDAVTNAESGSNLNKTNLQAWLNKRQKINNFFRSAGYKNIRIEQKAYPINYLKLEKPQGRELQMRGDVQNPLRNQISTAQTARLISEIVSERAISAEYSRQMRSLMNLDWFTRQEKLQTANSRQFNPVLGFFSQSLAQDINIAHKAGWTSQERNEAAYITSKDGKVAYILVIFGENSDYAQDWDIFPQLSAQIYQQLSREKP